MALYKFDFMLCYVIEARVIKCTFECDLSVDQQLTITWLI